MLVKVEVLVAAGTSCVSTTVPLFLDFIGRVDFVTMDTMFMCVANTVLGFGAGSHFSFTVVQHVVCLANGTTEEPITLLARHVHFLTVSVFKIFTVVLLACKTFFPLHQ